MTAALDITGQRFGLLVALRRAGTNAGGRVVWDFQCDCGITKRMVAASVKFRTRSCGCVKSGWGNKGRSPASKTHGRSNTRPYSIYKNMKERCYNPKNDRYADYGGRGIAICEDWLRDSSAFLAWVDSAGYADGLQIDRIDNDGPYSPDNCRWVTPRENMASRRNTRAYLVHGKRMHIEDVGRVYGIKPSTFRHRVLNLGYSPEEALTAKPAKGAGAASARAKRAAA